MNAISIPQRLFMNQDGDGKRHPFLKNKKITSEILSTVKLSQFFSIFFFKKSNR